MDKSDIETFWGRHPCDDQLVGGLEKYSRDYDLFFSRYDQYRYSTESHILNCLDDIDFNGKQTLEIGLGQGADAKQIIRRAGQYGRV